MARDFAAELAAARTAGDWVEHDRIWEERRVGSVEADEATLEGEYAPGDKVVYRGEQVEIDSRYEHSGDYLVLCGDGYYRQANPLSLSRPAGLPDQTAERSALVGGVQLPGTAPASGKYEPLRWQIERDQLGYDSISETDEDGRPGDLVAHVFSNHEHLVAAAPRLRSALIQILAVAGTPTTDSQKAVFAEARNALGASIGASHGKVEQAA